MGDLSEHISEAVIDAMSVTETDLDDQKIYDIVCKMERQGIETIKTMPVNNQWGYVLQDIFTNIKNGNSTKNMAKSIFHSHKYCMTRSNQQLKRPVDWQT